VSLSIIDSTGPRSNPTPAVRPWPREPIFTPRLRNSPRRRDRSGQTTTVPFMKGLRGYVWPLNEEGKGAAPLMRQTIYSDGQGLEILKARTKAYRFPKCQSGNPDGQSKFYHQCRKLAREASPEMMRGLVDLAKNAEDERVRSVCLVAVLDRAGIRPIGQTGSGTRATVTLRSGALQSRGSGDHRAGAEADVGRRELGSGGGGHRARRRVGRHKGPKIQRRAPKSSANPIGVAAEAFTPVCRRPQVANDRCRGVGRLHRHARAVGPEGKGGSVVPTVRPSGKRRPTAGT
jgi:hypothetical protein